MPVILSGVQYSGSWTLQQQMQAKQAGTWPDGTQRELWMWGQNSLGDLGLNDTVNKSSPVQVGALTNWLVMALTNRSTLAIKTDGTLWSWGRNDYGQLGQNIASTVNISSPVQVGSGTTWSKVAGGWRHVLATKTDGTLWSWGANDYGQLGQNIATTINRSSPVQVGALTTWLNVACGWYHSIAIKTDGTLWTWGYNTYGALGINVGIGNYSSPKQVGALTTWASASGGIEFTAAIKTDGTLWSWGRNQNGQLGQNIAYNISRSSPVQIGAQTYWAYVSCMEAAVAATTTNNYLFTWGRNSQGQLGDDTSGPYASKSSPSAVGSAVWSRVSVNSISEASCIATRTDGTLWTWGYNNPGQLGLGNITNYSSPKQVGALTTWLIPSMGRAHACATKTP